MSVPKPEEIFESLVRHKEMLVHPPPTAASLGAKRPHASVAPKRVAPKRNGDGSVRTARTQLAMQASGDSWANYDEDAIASSDAVMPLTREGKAAGAVAALRHVRSASVALWNTYVDGIGANRPGKGDTDIRTGSRATPPSATRSLAEFHKPKVK